MFVIACTVSEMLKFQIFHFEKGDQGHLGVNFTTVFFIGKYLNL